MIALAVAWLSKYLLIWMLIFLVCAFLFLSVAWREVYKKPCNDEEEERDEEEEVFEGWRIIWTLSVLLVLLAISGALTAISFGYLSVVSVSTEKVPAATEVVHGSSHPAMGK